MLLGGGEWWGGGSWQHTGHHPDVAAAGIGEQEWEWWVGRPGSMDFASWLASMGFSPTDISSVVWGAGNCAHTQTSDGGNPLLNSHDAGVLLMRGRGTGADTGGSGYQPYPSAY
jgi:hypothetical protein